MDDWPAYKRACDLSGSIFPVSEAVILATARKHGIGRKMGRTTIFSREDIQHLYEVLPCPSGSCAAPNHPTGSSAPPSGASALKKALAHLTDGSRKKRSVTLSPAGISLKGSPFCEEPQAAESAPRATRTATTGRHRRVFIGPVRLAWSGWQSPMEVAGLTG